MRRAEHPLVGSEKKKWEGKSCGDKAVNEKHFLSLFIYFSLIFIFNIYSTGNFLVPRVYLALKRFLFKRTEEEMSPQHFIQHSACAFAFSVPNTVIVIISALGD